MSSNNKNLCRVCVSENQEMKSIYSTDNFLGTDIEIFEVMKECASVQIDFADGLPNQICSKCLHQLHQSFTSKTLCEISDYNLRLDLAEGAKIEEDSDSPSELIDTNKEINCPYQNNVLLNIDKESEIDIKKGLELIKLLDGEEGTRSEKDFLEEFNFNNNIEDCKDMNSINNGTLENESKSKWYCYKCNKQFVFPSVYNIHMKKHIVEVSLQCEVCERGFANKRSLMKHKVSHNPKQKCVSTNTARNRHRRDAHPSKSSKYEFCPQQLPVSANHDKIFVCDFCFRRFDDSNTLAEHKNVHAGEVRKAYKSLPVLPYNKRTNTDGNMLTKM